MIDWKELPKSKVVQTNLRMALSLPRIVQLDSFAPMELRQQRSTHVMMEHIVILLHWSHLSNVYHVLLDIIALQKTSLHPQVNQ